MNAVLPGDRDLHTATAYPAQYLADRFGLTAAFASVIASHLFAEARP